MAVATTEVKLTTLTAVTATATEGATDNNQLKRQQKKWRWQRKTAEATSWWRRWHKAEAIVPVETVDAKVSAATAWTPWLRFVRCWPDGVQSEEGLL